MIRNKNLDPASIAHSLTYDRVPFLIPQGDATAIQWVVNAQAANSAGAKTLNNAILPTPFSLYLLGSGTTGTWTVRVTGYTKRSLTARSKQLETEEITTTGTNPQGGLKVWADVTEVNVITAAGAGNFSLGYFTNSATERPRSDFPGKAKSTDDIAGLLDISTGAIVTGFTTNVAGNYIQHPQYTSTAWKMGYWLIKRGNEGTY